MITTAQAFAGPWALNVRGWAWTIVPTAGVVVAQELATPSLGPRGVVTSAVFQLVAVTVWSIAVVAVSRLLHHRVVPVASGLLWLGNGVLHGLVGGAVAAADGADPEWGYRFAFWIVATVTWMPLLTYGLAQWDHYRTLLADRRRVSAALERATARAADEAGSRERRFSAAVGSAIQPALVELRAQLAENGARVDPATAQAIAGRLDELARTAARFTTIERAEPTPTRPTRVSLAEASVDFELSRPVFAALLSAALIATPLLAEAFRVGGWGHAGAMAVAIAVATLTVAIAFMLLRRGGLSASQRSTLSRIGVVAAGFGGTAVLLALGGIPPEPAEVALLVVFPLLQMLGSSLTATAVALWAANVETEDSLAVDREALADLERRLRADEEETRARLHTLLRGDLNGRLAGSAMALAFVAGSDVAEDARGAAVARVLEQLDAAIAELDSA